MKFFDEFGQVFVGITGFTTIIKPSECISYLVVVLRDCFVSGMACLGRFEGFISQLEIFASTVCGFECFGQKQGGSKAIPAAFPSNLIQVSLAPLKCGELSLKGLLAH
ncbi:hypothetical protein WL14_27850 [Burkholderia cepacia]|nr:hypothetical protein WJ46_09420 [Burkholderia cepacia]KVQ23241.1 hypothetical protein WK02_31685 [Burkholderia cepacia]KVZ19552.1 hypothetical protein WL14_27850 [Burkholderia cepacia]